MAKSSAMADREAKWVEENLTGRTWGWEELVLNRISLDQCPPRLRRQFAAFRLLHHEIAGRLDELGYKPG